MSVSKMREEIGLSDYKVRKWLEILDEKKLVQRMGSGPATRYAVRETSDEKITLRERTVKYYDTARQSKGRSQEKGK